MLNTTLMLVVCSATAPISARSQGPDLQAFHRSFSRALALSASEQPDEAKRFLDEARRSMPVDGRAKLLEQDCRTLLELSSADADQLLRWTNAPPAPGAVPAELRGVLLRSLSWDALADAGRGRDRSALKKIDVAVELARLQSDPTQEAWALRSRAEALYRLAPQNQEAWSFREDVRRADGLFAVVDDTASRNSLELLSLKFESQYGNPAGALRRLDALGQRVDARSSTAVELLWLRLAALCRAEDLSAAQADGDLLAELLRQRDQRARNHAAAMAVGEWARLQHVGARRKDWPALELAEWSFGTALELAQFERERVQALRWRGWARNRLNRHTEARRDFEQASELLEEQEASPFLLSELLLSQAWTEHFLQNNQRAQQLLERHDRSVAGLGLTGNAQLMAIKRQNLLRILIALRTGDLLEAQAAMGRRFSAMDELIAPINLEQSLKVRETAWQARALVLGRLLDEWERRPDRRKELFGLAAGQIEHRRVRLLRRILFGRRPAPTILTFDELPELPPGVAELRWARGLWSNGDEESYVLLARFDDQILFTRLDQADQLDAQVDRFLTRWMTPRNLRADPADYAAEASTLARSVLGPALDWLERGTGAPDRLLLMTDGLLARLPFEALTLSTGEHRGGFAGLPYLIRGASILHAPSISILLGLPAPNDFETAVIVLDPLVKAPDGKLLPSLRFTPDEQTAIESQHSDTQVLSRGRARLSELKRVLAQAPVGWLHLASHAVSDPSTEDRAALLLSADSRGQQMLGGSEVTQLGLTPGIRVILSACGTGGGKLLRQEGAQALWRSFLSAGAACVLSTRRPVDDRSAACWMKTFHSLAGQGLPLADAARSASLAWLDGGLRPDYPRGSAIIDSAHPYLWAAYECVGNDGGRLPLAVPKGSAQKNSSKKAVRREATQSCHAPPRSLLSTVRSPALTGNGDVHGSHQVPHS